jgi:hypothetical protein
MSLWKTCNSLIQKKYVQAYMWPRRHTLTDGKPAARQPSAVLFCRDHQAYCSDWICGLDTARNPSIRANSNVCNRQVENV